MEGSMEWYRGLFQKIINDGLKNKTNQRDCLDLLLNMREDFAFSENKEVRDYAMKISKYAHEMAGYMAAQTGSGEFDDLYWKYLLLEAPEVLDSYCLYIEKDRKPKERFYQPRRKTLIKVVNLLQRLENDELDEAFIHMPARVGKTQIITLGTSWHCCRNTELSNLYCSYKEDAGGAFLDGVKEIWTDPIYLHNNVFPLAKIVDTDAKANTVDLERKKKYKSLSGKGLTSGLNGLYDATGWLIADDILEGIQDVLSPDVLKRKQIIFDNNLMKRKKEKCKVIYNGTIWSLHDIYMNRMAFLENNPEAKDIRWEVLKIPALDTETDESNFDYDYNLGFSTQYYRIERAKFEEEDDMASWFSQCQQEPIERDGALFNPEHMNFYNGVLPSEEPLKIVSACDVALGGISNYFHQGSRIVVHCHVQNDNYTNKEGNKVYQTNFIVDSFSFVDTRVEGGITQNQGSQPAPSPTLTDQGGFMNIPDGIDEELPFV